MNDTCPKCGIDIWSDTTSHAFVDSDGEEQSVTLSHQVGGIDCLRNQLAQRDETIIQRDARIAELETLIDRYDLREAIKDSENTISYAEFREEPHV